MTAPIIKWVGGKKRLLPELKKYTPDTFNVYYELFFGGGAFFFDLQPENAVLNDYNSELVNLYSTVKTDVESLITELQSDTYENTLETFMFIRSWDRDIDFQHRSPVQRAARFLYLNRTSFNGLYRVNKNNQFNVPYGKYVNPPILNEVLLREAHKTLNRGNVVLQNLPFEKIVNQIQGAENFIYLDPPYVPLTADSFVGYTDTNFSMSQHETVAKVAQEQDSAGNFVLVSNSDSPLIPELYPGFMIVKLDIQRTLGAKKETRGKIQETLLIGETLQEKLKM